MHPQRYQHQLSIISPQRSEPQPHRYPLPSFSVLIILIASICSFSPRVGNCFYRHYLILYWICFSSPLTPVSNSLNDILSVESLISILFLYYFYIINLGFYIINLRLIDMLLLTTSSISYNHSVILKKFLECTKFFHELIILPIYIPLPEMLRIDSLFMIQIESHSFLPLLNTQSYRKFLLVKAVILYITLLTFIKISWKSSLINLSH